MACCRDALKVETIIEGSSHGSLGMMYQSAKVAGMRAPRNNSSSEMPGRQLSQIKSALVRGVSTYTCARAFSAAGDDMACADGYVLHNMMCLTVPYRLLLRGTEQHIKL